MQDDSHRIPNLKIQYFIHYKKYKMPYQQYTNNALIREHFSDPDIRSYEMRVFHEITKEDFARSF